MYRIRNYETRRAARVLVLSSALGEQERMLELGKFMRLCNEVGVSELELVQEATEADFVFLATGGVEHMFLEALERGVSPAVYAPRPSNAFAALNEVRAYLRARHKSLMVFGADELDLASWLEVASARRLLKEAKIVSFGEKAPWLVASEPAESLLRERLGLSVIREDWSALGWENYESKKELLEQWQAFPKAGVESERLERCIQLSSALLDYAQRERCDIVLAGCFPLLSQHVSACLALSDLLDNGILAVCENDLCSAVSMLFLDFLGLCSSPPWMANLVSIEGDCIELHHCTIAKGCVKAAELLTHFESQDAAALGGQYIMDEILVMRVDERLEKLYLCRGEVLERRVNVSGCRTAIRVCLEHALREPLGNHHIVIPANDTARIKAFARLMQMEVVES
ncbi:MAG: hypothetical protein WC966_11675 [Bradymonadales bacterium]